MTTTQTKSEQENAKLDALVKLAHISKAGRALADAAIELELEPEELQCIVLGYAKKIIRENKN